MLEKLYFKIFKEIQLDFAPSGNPARVSYFTGTPAGRPDLPVFPPIS